MVAPILIAVGYGAMTGLAAGYVIDKTIGDGNYTSQEMITDATLGAIGVGFFKHAYRVGKSSQILRQFDKSVDVISDIPKVLLLANRKEIPKIIKTGAYTVLVGKTVEVGYASSKSYQQNVGKPSSAIVSTGKSRVPAKKATKRFQKKKPKYCSFHRKYDYCYNK